MQNKKEAVIPPVLITGMSRLDEKRLDELYSQNYCKSETNNMKFNEFMMFVLDKGFLGSKLNLQFFYEDYCKTLIEEEGIQIEESQITKKSTINKLLPQKEAEKGLHRFTRNKFLQFIERIGKKLFITNKKSLDLVLKEIFKERQVSKLTLSGDTHRVMVFDEINKRFMTERPISVLLKYEKQIQILFVLYQSQNYGREEIMLEWDEIRLMNLRLPTSQLIQLLFDANLLTSLITVEMIEDVLVKILPATVPKEHQFYQSDIIEKVLEKIQTNKWKPVVHEGDPRISYFDLQMILGRFAMDIAQKELSQDIKKDMSIPLVKFLEENLGLSCDDQPLDITRKHLSLMQIYIDKKKEPDTDDNLEQTLLSQFSPTKKPQNIQDKNYEILTNTPEQMDLQEIISMIQTEFPPLPAFNTVDTIALKQRKIYENHLNKIEEAKRREEEKLNKKGNKQAPKPSKDKEPKREISNSMYQFKVWEPTQPVVHLDSHQHILNHLQEIQHNVNPYQQLTQSISFSHVQASPVLLPEILYPADLPGEVQPLIESTILFFTQQNYFSAFENLERAQVLWLKITKKDELNDDTMLYFEYVAAQIYETAGQDEAAMNKFMKVKYFADRLAQNHPDRALPFCGFGSVLYHLREYSLAFRAFLKAKQIRDECIGSENVENAIIYNNMGCCLHQMTQFFDAETCYQFAEAIFDIHLGCFHEKTLNAKRNIQKLLKDRRHTKEYK